MNLYPSINEKLFNLNFAKKSRYNFHHLKAVYDNLNLKPFLKIHVAGTNGKGSVVTKISEALTLSGYKCGSFTSPHIASFRERIQIDGHMISKEDLAKYAAFLFSFCEERKIELTFFEVMTFLALKYFEEKKVDVAVIEVGLGGRLDATNCITPILSVITSISFDHQAILGNTLEKIASEKAGIIKKNIPVLLGPKANQNSIFEKAKEMKAPVFQVTGEYESYDEENQAIAKRALELVQNHFNVPKELASKALQKKPPCRFQKEKLLNHEVILDVSHNEDGLRRFFYEVSSKYLDVKKVVFTSMAFNHDYHKNLKIISENADQVYVLDLIHPRLASAGELLNACSSAEICNLNQIKQKVEQEGENTLIIFTGSIFIMSKVYEILDLPIEEDLFMIHDGLFRSADSR